MDKQNNPSIKPHQSLDDMLAEQASSPAIMPENHTPPESEAPYFQIKPAKALMQSMTGGERLGLMALCLVIVGVLGSLSPLFMLLGMVYAFGGERPVAHVNAALRALQDNYGDAIDEIKNRIRRFIETKSEGQGALSLFSGWGWNKLGYIFIAGSTLMSLRQIGPDKTIEQNAALLLVGALTFAISTGLYLAGKKLGQGALSRTNKTELRFCQIVGTGWLFALLTGSQAMIGMMSLMTFTVGPIFMVVSTLSKRTETSPDS